MNKIKAVICCLIVILSLNSVVNGASVNANARVDGFTIRTCNANDIATEKPAPATLPPPPPNATVINFDDVTAPCVFSETIALRDQYSGLGVLFIGPAVNDGGGILDQCSSFGVTGYSAPNFLAFNANVCFSNGGIPRPPETITFINGARYVQVNVGSSSGAGQTITMEAYNAEAEFLGSDSLTLASTLDTLSITADGIAWVMIITPASVFVLDDLAFLGPYRSYLPLVIKD